MYKRLTRGLNDPGILIHKDEDPYNHLNLEQDAYLSIFDYTPEQNEQFKKTGTISGITDVSGDRLVWDFDSKNIDLARLDALKLIDNLEKYNMSDDAAILFSGGKGFEVSVEISMHLTPKETKTICSNLAKDLTTFDKVIYNASRQMRLPLTKHQVSGLYKIPLTHQELKTLQIDKIKELAKGNDFMVPLYRSIEVNEQLLELFKSEEIKKESESLAIQFADISEIDWSKKPKDLTGAKWLLELGFIPEGYRNHAMMILASTYRSLGYSKEKAYYMLKCVSEAYAGRNGLAKCSKEEIWNTVITQVFGPNWNGGTYSEKTDDLLHTLSLQVPEKLKSKISKEILDVSGVADLFKDYVGNIDKNRLSFGIPSLDDNLDSMVGRVYVFGGSPGCGKSSIGIQILNNVSKRNIPGIFFSFDMGLSDVYQKVIQKHFKIGSRKVYEMCKDPLNLLMFNKTIQENYKNIKFTKSSGMTLEKMRETIEQVEADINEDVKLIVVDYLDLVQADFSDATQKSMFVMQGLKSIATDMNKCIIVLAQPNKANQKISESVESYAAIKGSGAITELANAVIWIYRPGASPKDFTNDKWYVMDCLKNRHGALFSLPFGWEGVSGTISELNDIQIDELNGFIKSKDNSNDF